MKKIFPLLLILSATLLACDDDDIRVFEKTADERAAEAIAALKADLVAPSNGWRVRYRPVDGSGSFYVLMKFGEDNKVNIKSDLAADDKSYVNQTIGYRIDNSLGLELVLENYSMFHYLYEQDQATFYAEYEFEFVNKTPDDALVFVSKSDFSDKTTILFEEASGNDQNLLGVTISENLETLSEDLDLFSSSIKIEFADIDLILYGGFDVSKRTFFLSGSTPKSNSENIQFLNYSSAYIVQGGSLVFDSPIAGNFAGVNLSISSISLSTLTEDALNICADPTPVHKYAGQTSSGENISFESTIVNAGGRGFTNETLFVAPISNIRKDGSFVFDEIEQELPTAAEMYLLYNFSYRGEIITGMGFWLLDANGNGALVFKEFTATFDSNKISFNFKPGIRTIAEQTGFVLEPEMNNISKFLDALAEGGTTYVYKYADGIYEFNNPCNKWAIVFVAS